jgi:GT2 family glycosyltransferase
VTVTVAAIVVANSADLYLAETLSQLSKQLHPIQQVMVVDTANSVQTSELVSSFGFSLVQPGDLPLGAAVDAGIAALAQHPQWLWILHDDSAPEPNALSQLARAAELSESVAVVGPKLLRWELPVEIQQLGLTITPSGKPFLLVESEFDQGQFDVRSDTLAVSTAGMLVGFEVWQKLGGLDDRSPVLAQDIEFSLKARAAGYRVVVEPSAKVLHAGLSMQGKRSRKWLGGGYRSAIAKAHLHLATLLSPALLIPFIYLLLPLAVIAQLPLNIVSKRLGKSVGQGSAWLWGWFTWPSRLAARKRLRSFGSLAAVGGLVATRKQIKQKQSKELEFPPEETKAGHKGFFASGAFYLSLLIPVLSIGAFPLAALQTDASLIGRSFESIWANTGVVGVQYLTGVAYPSDPFNWFFALLALLPVSPSLALNWFVFLSGSLAFIAAWLLLGQLTKKTWLRNLAALGFALSPQALLLQSSGAAVELAVMVFTPITLYLILKTKSAFNAPRSWRWTALAGLTGAIVAVANPVVFGLIFVFAFFILLRSISRAPQLLASFIPGVALILPWLEATLASQLELVALTSSARVATDDQSLWYLIGLAVFVVIASLRSSAVIALGSAALVAGLVSVDRLLGFGFAEVTALIMLAITVLFVAIVDSLKSQQARAVAASTTAVFVGSSAILFGALALRPAQAEDLVAPALVVAQADAEVSTRTLLIRFDPDLSAELIWGDGRSVDEKSVMYSALGADSQIKQPLANLTAQLVAANPAAVGELLNEIGIDFVLVSGNSAQALSTKASISGMEFFQISGDSQFGSLYRVTIPVSQPEFSSSAPYRDVQLAILGFFALLTIPTPATIRGYRRRGSR